MNKIEFFGAGREALFAPVVLPKIGKTKDPGIVLLPAIAGINDYMKRVAYRLLASDLAVAILDYFAREGRPHDISTPAAIDVAVNSLSDHRVLSVPCANTRRSIQNESVHLRMPVVSFCIGGTYSLMLSAETPNLSASVDYYGSVRYAKTSDQKPVSPLDRAKAIQAPLLAHFGTFDLLIAAADIEALETELKWATKPYELFTYNGAPHAFDEDFRPAAYVPSHPNWPGSAR